MTLEKLQQDMYTAMKAREKDRKDVLTSLIGNVKKAAIDEGCRDNVPEELVDRVILKELKTIKEQIDTCPETRVNLLNAYKYNYEVVSEYAPKMLSKDEVMEILTTKFVDVIATKNKGQIMKAVMSELKGKADGKMINTCVAELVAK